MTPDKPPSMTLLLVLAVPYPGEGGVAPEMFTVAACAPSIAGTHIPAPAAPNAMAATQNAFAYFTKNAPEVLRRHGIFLQFFLFKSRGE